MKSQEYVTFHLGPFNFLYILAYGGRRRSRQAYASRFHKESVISQVASPIIDCAIKSKIFAFFFSIFNTYFIK
jgi:hypothetical protein